MYSAIFTIIPMSVNNTFLTAVEPVASPIGQIVHTVGLLLGGVVGIALLSFFIRIYFIRKLNRKVERIESDVQWIKNRLQTKETNTITSSQTKKKGTKKKRQSKSSDH